MKSPTQRTRRTPRFAFLLSVILLAPFAGILVVPDSRILGNPLCDNPEFFYYVGHFVGACWRSGEIPLWNPYIMLGIPCLGEGQGAVFHPLTLLYVLLPTAVAIDGLIAVCVLLSGLGFRGYLRALGLGEEAALCGAVCWAFSSVFVTRIYAGHLSMLLALASLPYLLMGWERYRRSGRAGFLVLFAVAYACLVLAGHPQSAYLFSLFVFLYVVVQSVAECRSRQDVRRSIRPLVSLAGFAALGAGIGAIQLIPSVDYASESFRAQASFEYVATHSFPPENALTILCPFFFGRSNLPGADAYWGRGYLWETLFYVGILPLIAAVAGAARAPARARAPLLVCAISFAVVALGSHTPLYRILYCVVPFYDVFRGASKHVIVAQFCLVALASYGFDGWFAKRRSATESPDALAAAAETDARAVRRKFDLAFAAGVCILLVLAFVAFSLFGGTPGRGSRWPRFLALHQSLDSSVAMPLNLADSARIAAVSAQAVRQILRAAFLTLLSLGLLLALTRRPVLRRLAFPLTLAILLADLATFCRPLFTTFDEKLTRYPTSLLSCLAGRPYPVRVHDSVPFVNSGMKHGFANIGGYTGNPLARYTRFMNAAEGKPSSKTQAYAEAAQIREATAGLLSAEYMVKRERDLAASDRPLAREKNRSLLPIAGPAPRVFLAESPEAVSTPEAALDRFLFGRGGDPVARPGIETSGSLPPAAPLGPGETAKIVSFCSSRVEIDVRAARARLLVLNEMYYKDWRARVNGQAVPVYRANYLFRAVEVPAGDSRVVFEYVSPALRAGAAVSGGSVLALLGVLLFPALRKSGKRDRSAS